MSASIADRAESDINSVANYKRWDRAIKDLAADLQKPETQVRGLFQAEVQKLEDAAKVKRFIPVFALRRVKELL
jgi:hypothetical protein